MPSLPPSSPEGSYVPKSPTGRFEHSEPAIQNIPIPEGVSEFQDTLAGMMKLHEKAMQGALGIPAHLLEMNLTQSNFDCAKVEQRLLRQAEIDRRMDRIRRRYGVRADGAC